MNRLIRFSLMICCIAVPAVLLCSGCGKVDPETKKAVTAKEAELNNTKSEYSKLEDAFDQLNDKTLKKRKVIAKNKARTMTAQLQIQCVLHGETFPKDIKAFVKLMGKLPKDPVYFSDIVLVKDSSFDAGKVKGGWIYFPEKGVVEANL